MNSNSLNVSELNTTSHHTSSILETLSLPQAETEWYALLQAHIQNQAMHPIMKGISVSLNLLNKISTKQAGNKAFGLWFTPQSKPIRDEDKDWLDQAEISHISVNRIRSGKTKDVRLANVPVYRWNHEHNQNGEKILCTHGWGGHAGQFTQLAKHLVAQGYQVMSFDLPGHGRAEGKSSNLAEMSLIVEQLIATEGKFKAIIAHSLAGAGVNNALNQQHTKACDKLVVLNAPMSLDHMVHTFKHQLNLDTEIIDQHKQKLVDTFGSQVWSNFDLRNNQHHTPTLWCYDKNDDQVPFQVADYLHHQNNQSVLIETEKLGHNKAVRNEQVIKQITDYLESH
jgi:pimeloyl-ACP methyl ester carboxylesterase